MSVVRQSIRMSSPGGRIVGTLFLLIFLAAGLFFAGLLGREVFRIAQTYSWPRIECVILESKVVEHQSSSAPYDFTVRYQYEWKGRSFTADTYSRQQPSFSDYGKAQRLALRFPVDIQAHCYVNPANPSEAVLARQNLWIGFFIVIPLVFVLVGGGGIYALWFRGNTNGSSDGASRAPLSSRSLAEVKGLGFLVVFFFVFFAVGCGAFYAVGIRPALQVFSARSWRETPCTVISSRVQSHRGDDSTTYSVDILYAYECNGESLKSSRYNFMGGSSSGYDGKATIVNRYPPGRKTVCYVDPNDPNEAVLVRDFTPSMLLGLLPLIFVAVGVGGMSFTIRKMRQSREPDGSWSAQRVESFSGLRPAVPAGQPVELKARWPRFGKLVASLLVAAFWNGIVSVFVWQVIQSWQKGRPEWFLTIFMIPFVLVGLGLLGWVGHSFLGLFNPTVRLVVNTPAVPLGGALGISWEIHGRIHVIDRLRIYLEGREEATYKRGTRTHTDRQVFATFDLASITSRTDMRSGRARITVPASTMHSFTASHNKITWTLHVHGDIARWPDIKEEFPVTLLPLPAHSIPTP